MSYNKARQQVHEAIGGLLKDGEIAIGWTLTVDVAGPDDMRYLAHRAGGGIDGNSPPLLWTLIGMLRACALSAEGQLAESTEEADDDEEDEGDED